MLYNENVHALKVENQGTAFTYVQLEGLIECVYPWSFLPQLMSLVETTGQGKKAVCVDGANQKPGFI